METLKQTTTKEKVRYKRNLNAKDMTQNRYESLENLHTHPYDPELLETVRKDMMKPRTCKEFMDWVDTHPHYDTVAEASSQYIRGTDQSEVYWKCAEINTDWRAIMEKISSYSKEHRIDEDFSTDYTDEWRIHDMEEQDTFVPFRHNSELDNQRKHGFLKHYQLIEVTLTDVFPELKEVEKCFDMEWAKTDINYQPTSGAFPRHVDFLTTQLKRAVEYDPEIANLEYDPVNKNPVGWQLKRVLVACDNWYPGQLFNFEEHNWSNWKAGDTVDFNWKHARHATANCGYNPRPLLKITGLVRDDHWLCKNEFRRFDI
jgi:hypothetical protein